MLQTYVGLTRIEGDQLQVNTGVMQEYMIISQILSDRFDLTDEPSRDETSSTGTDCL